MNKFSYKRYRQEVMRIKEREGMNLTAQINTMVEQLEEPEQLLLVELLKRLVPDNVATVEDFEDIRIAEQELAEGKTISFSNINWD